MSMKAVPLAVASVLLLGGCQTTSVPTSPIVNIGVGLLPESIQEHVKNACGWLEPVQSIVAIASRLGGFTVPDIANQVAQEICTAVRPPLVAGRRASSPKRVVVGVTLQGYFVR
jgi:hypothetical protein